MEDSKIDFMKQDNFFLASLVAFFMNITVLQVGFWSVFKGKESYIHIFWILQASNVIHLLVMIKLIWQGTNFSQFYAKENIIVIGSLTVVTLVIVGFVAVNLSQDLLDEQTDVHDIRMLSLFNCLNSLGI